MSHAHHRRPDHDPQRRRRPGAAAAHRRHQGRDRAHLEERRGDGAGLRAPPTSWPPQLRPVVGPVHVDKRDNMRPGWKYAEWERKGVPLRLELGPRDLAGQQVMMAARHDRQEAAGRVRRPGRDGGGRAGRASSRSCTTAPCSGAPRTPTPSTPGTTSSTCTPTAAAASPTPTGAATAGCEQTDPGQDQGHHPQPAHRAGRDAGRLRPVRRTVDRAGAVRAVVLGRTRPPRGLDRV